jgi:hypothetical protein
MRFGGMLLKIRGIKVAHIAYAPIPVPKKEVPNRAKEYSAIRYEIPVFVVHNGQVQIYRVD